jgi:hypothetical protein
VERPHVRTVTSHVPNPQIETRFQDQEFLKAQAHPGISRAPPPCPMMEGLGTKGYWVIFTVVCASSKQLILHQRKKKIYYVGKVKNPVQSWLSLSTANRHQKMEHHVTNVTHASPGHGSFDDDDEWINVQRTKGSSKKRLLQF